MVILGAGFNPLQAQGTAADQQLVNQVAASNLVEVRFGEAAQDRATNASVKQFAQSMVTEHTAMQKDWMAAAKKNRLEFKASFTPEEMEQSRRLRTLSGSEFDRTYMTIMVQHHRNNVSSFQSQLGAAHVPDVQQLIQAGLPRLQQHLTQAQQIAVQVGADMTASGTPTNPPVATQPTTPPTTTPTTTTPTTTTPTTTQPAPASPSAQTVRADSGFIGVVQASNTAELRLARIGRSRATNDDVKRFAEQMTSDHDELQQEWSALAVRNGVQLSPNPNQRLELQAARLERLSGNEFDRAFMSVMVQNHQEAVNTFQTRGQAAQSSEVRQLVSRSLPALQQHLTLARRVAGQVRADTTAIIAANDDRDNDDGANDNQGKRGNIRQDEKFIREVDADNYLEIRLGQLAVEKARDERVKAYGRRMVNDHTLLQRQWTTMASNNGMKFKSGMGRRHRAKLTGLQNLSGARFDREYMTLVLQNHQDYLDYFRKEGRGANTAQVRQLVNRGIPLLEQQLRQGKKFGARVGAYTTTSRYGRISANDRMNNKDNKDNKDNR
jgi:putative membrane protein